MINLDRDKTYREVASAFKQGWDKAGKEGCVSPELAKALTENMGIHPDRVGEYMEAVSAHRTKRGDKPDPKDFKEPKVVTFCKPAAPGSC